MLSGDNGILTKTTEAKNRNDAEQIKERIKLAYHSALAGGQGSYTKESLEDELELEFGENNYNVDDSDNANWILSAKGQDVTIPAGKKGTNSGDKLSEEQLKAIIENEAGNCMIDEAANIIPINVWQYRLDNDNETAIIEGSEWYDEEDDQLYTTNAYKGNIVGGKLEYGIPVFIKNNDKIYKVIELGDYACSKIWVDCLTIPDNILKLGYLSFYTSSIPNLEIPSSVTRISSYAFKNFKGSILLNDGLEKICQGAFWESNITNINIPSTVTEIEGWCFAYCTNLTKITFEDTNNWFENNGSQFLQIDVTDSSLNATRMVSQTPSNTLRKGQ